MRSRRATSLASQTTADPVDQTAAGHLDAAERQQLSRLRRWGTTGSLLLAVASLSSYGAATPVPNPMDGLRIVGLLSRVGTGALMVSFTGVGLLVMCWFLLGRLAVPGRPRRLSRTQLSHTLAMWAAPLLVIPPLFSRDVYSYLAVGQMSLDGFNPYATGPYDVLGDTDPFAHQVDARWQHTPSPYGPAYILIVRAVVAIGGSHLIAAILLQRLVEMIGVVAIVWAIPRLAKRAGVDPVAALWIGALNPLVLFHLIGGAHNEALMLGAMLAGLYVAMSRSVWLGVLIITAGIGVKATAALALPFLVIYLARRKSPRLRDLITQAAYVGAVFLAGFAALTVVAGHGIGWLTATLKVPGSVLSFLSPSTGIGAGAAKTGQLLGLGNHWDTMITVAQRSGTFIGLAIACWVMWRCWRSTMQPLFGLGLAMGAFVLLSPIVHPWYLLWALLPLTTSTADPRWWRGCAVATVFYAVVSMPRGGPVPPLTVLVCETGALLVCFIVLIGLCRKGLPTTLPRNT